MIKLLVPPAHTAPLGQGKHPDTFINCPVTHDVGIAQVDIPDIRGFAVLLFEGSAGYCPLGQVAG